MAAMARSEDESMSLSAVTKRTLRLINHQCAMFDQHVVQEEANEARQVLGKCVLVEVDETGIRICVCVCLGECRSVLKKSVSLYRAQGARSKDLYEHAADTIEALTAVSERTGSALATQRQAATGHRHAEGRTRIQGTSPTHTHKGTGRESYTWCEPASTNAAPDVCVCVCVS